MPGQGDDGDVAAGAVNHPRHHEPGHAGIEMAMTTKTSGVGSSTRSYEDAPSLASAMTFISRWPSIEQTQAVADGDVIVGEDGAEQRSS